MIGQAAALPVRIGPASPSDLDAALAMVSRCSRASLTRRFHGPSDGIAYTTAQLRRPDDIVLLAWEGGRCIGMGVVAGTDSHLGVLVEDNRQRTGIGRRLVGALVAETLRRGCASIHADVMGDDAGLVAALRRVGPARVTLSAGTYEMQIDITGRSGPVARGG